MSSSLAPLASALVRAAVLVCLVAPVLIGGAPSTGAVVAAVTPVWPVPDLVTDLSGLLKGLYDQEASAATPYNELAPEWEADKWRASKDPDTLWEIGGGGDAACHAAATVDEFSRCTGYRLATALGLDYHGGASLFDPAAGFDANAARVSLASSYALYHAYVRDFDASLAGPYDQASARNAKAYHTRMVAAYEAHMRRLLLGMFRDTRDDAEFQLGLTMGLGRLEILYVRTVEAVEEYGAWSSPADRRNALALINGMNQRIWWEWVWTQSDGPRTAGFVDLGSELTQEAAAATGPRWEGTDQFVYDGSAIASLRPGLADTGDHSGFWLDADYTVPGEWWCYDRYYQYTTSLQACLAQARGESLGGSRSPFGQFYGPTTGCGERAGNVTTRSCGTSNRGSIAGDWVEAFLGARFGMFLMRELAASSDPDLPQGTIGPAELDTVTARLGYGASGWHGGPGHQDDMEWTWSTTAPVVSIRTLSAARHDLEAQDGRFSLGETDTSSFSVERRGDTWREDLQEFPGAVERHSPGPNPYYGAQLLALVLADRTSDGLAGSFYDAFYRNEPDEFNSWLWLTLATFNRCAGVADPSDGSCFAATTADWPYPTEVHRVPLFNAPTDSAVDLRFRYLWRNPETVDGQAIAEGSIAERDTSCRGGGGLPWQHANDWATGANSPYLIDEGGFGAYRDLLLGYGGMMRLIAARYPLSPADEALAGEYATQRDGVLVPWYNEMYRQLKALIALYEQAPPDGYSYIPDVENSTCVGFNPYTPSDPVNKMVLTWQVGTGDTIAETVAHRASGYAAIAEWYWWFAGDWLDIDQAAW